MVQTQDFGLVSQRMKCGCILGEHYCKVGLRLHNALVAAFHRQYSGLDRTGEYAAAYENYIRHFDEPEK